MHITITDPMLLAQFKAVVGSVRVQGPDGDHIGEFHAPFGKPPPGYVPPFTDEELAERRKEKTGRSLDEILRDLRAKDDRHN